MIIEDNRNEMAYWFDEIKNGDVFFLATEDNDEIADTTYGVCMKIDGRYCYSFETNEALETASDKVVLPVNAKLVLY